MNNSWDFAQGMLRTTKLHHKEMHISKLFSCGNPFQSKLYKINPRSNIYIHLKKKFFKGVGGVEGGEGELKATDPKKQFHQMKLHLNGGTVQLTAQTSRLAKSSACCTNATNAITEACKAHTTGCSQHHL